MKALKYTIVLVLLLSLTVPAAFSQEGPLMPDIPDTGELFGDLYVILRDVNGVPILREYTVVGEEGETTVYCVQPISAVDGTVTIETNGDPLVITVYEGEPFALPTYTDSAGDVVECELTEDMLAWVQAVDFGRLNLGRAPDGVIAHAFDEAITKMNEAVDIGISPEGRLVMDPGLDSEKTIDSPSENLALYIKMMAEGHWITLDTTAITMDKRPGDVGPPPDDGPEEEERPVLTEAAIAQLAEIGYGGLGVVVYDPATGLPDKTGEDLTNHELLLAASLLAAAADKTGNITLDMVVYINSIYGINQIGSIVPEEGKPYFNFGAFSYGRGATYASRGSEACFAEHGDGWIWVLQPELELYDENPDDEVPPALVPVENHYVTTCMNILGYDLGEEDPGYQANAVHFTDMAEIYDTVDPDYEVFDSNVRGFVQAADDSLQVLEYIHNYKVPEDLYPDD